MSNDMELKKYMAQAISEGHKLSEVQSMVNEKFGTKMTFLDVRILAAEIENIDWSLSDPKPVEKEEVVEEPQLGEADGKTIVESSKILRPGFLAGGTVKFASGAKADWFIDQSGRPGIDNVVGEPTESDVVAFQKELQALFARGQ